MAQIKQHTIKDLVDYVIKNRRNKAFEGWTADQLALAFNSAFGMKAASYSVDSEGNIVGVVLAEIAPDYKLVHIIGILTTSKEALKALVKKFKEIYDGWDIQGFRRGNLTRYKHTERLVNKLSK